MGTKILIMDDEVDTLNMLAMTLRFSGYEVATAETGKHALKLAAEFKPDVMILDVMMPDISGIEVLRTLKQTLPVVPPAIFLSASVRPVDQSEGMAAGAYAFLVKPVLRQKLVETLKLALASKPQ